MTAIPAPIDLHPGWWRALWAVVWGVVLASVAVGSLLLALGFVGVPALPVDDAATGSGLPWRVDGPWSFTADLGPLALFGIVFAYGVEGGLSSRGRIRSVSRLSPLVLLGMLLAVAKSASGGAPAIVALVAAGAALVVARQTAAPAREPIRWTHASASAALLVAVALSAATVSYAVLHPLSPGRADVRESADGRLSVVLAVHNDGPGDVTLLAVRTPVPGARVDGLAGERSVTLAGARIRRGAPQAVAVSLPSGCSGSWRVDRLDVRLRVHGRAVDQVLRLVAPVEVPCS